MPMIDRDEWERRAAAGDGQFAIALALLRVVSAIHLLGDGTAGFTESGSIKETPGALANFGDRLCDALEKVGMNMPTHLDVTVSVDDESEPQTVVIKQSDD
jgi:hypothetical protein